MKKICPTCSQTFEITQYQKSKIYCNDICKPTFRPNRGKPRTGRPKREV